MASIFTYDPDPPRVSSPWSTPGRATPIRGQSGDSPLVLPDLYRGMETPPPALLADCGVTRLEAEPQEGPTEYKLHLLLRKRRSLASSSTGHRVAGSYQSRDHVGASAHAMKSTPLSGPGPLAAPSTGCSQSRQHRLQQLTTQMLWRLQQSSPNHSSSLSNLIVPTFPELACASDSPTRPARLLPGLEESHGALYEIGVADDGTFIGLTEEEMDESLKNLRAMAASLGCSVRVLRMVVVGECQWAEDASSEDEPGRLRNDRLWVVEALVKPDLSGNSSLRVTDEAYPALRNPDDQRGADIVNEQSPIEQLRVSLTGATTSGKSSLLGTLSTATLDNGRGKSRLSLLRHRHELVSGVTSSVAQELLGYKSATVDAEEGSLVANFAAGNISSWMDIHASCESGRLVFFADSAGHPRYRRTTVRGLVGWAPHWTILCIAADREDERRCEPGYADETCEQTHSGGVPGPAGQSSTAHLQLCLRLGLPLVVVFTKLDRTSKIGLRQVLTETLSLLKAAGRKPMVLSASGRGTDACQASVLTSLSSSDLQIAGEAIKAIKQNDSGVVVPIVLTSAVSGMGVGTVHALLRSLPLPEVARPAEGVKETRLVFYIEDLFALPQSAVVSSQDGRPAGKGVQGAIVSGHLRYGTIAVGDELLLGPLSRDYTAVEPDGSRLLDPSSIAPVQAELRRPIVSLNHEEHLPRGHGCWKTVRVVSVRNLRLPVRRLMAGQVGTVGFTLQTSIAVDAKGENAQLHASVADAIPGLRKGMILTSRSGMYPASYVGFSGTFADIDVAALAEGSLVVVYIASIRAVARIVSIRPLHAGDAPGKKDNSEELFRFDQHDEVFPAPVSQMVVRFAFTATREWIELGTQVLVMPAGVRVGKHHEAHGRAKQDCGKRRHADYLLEGVVGIISGAYID